MAASNQKVVLVTGCSSGIGLETAVMLARDADKRFKVYASMRNFAKKDPLEKEGSDVLGKTLFIEKLDVSSEEQVEKVLDDLLAKEGRIDVIVNNAAFGWYGPTQCHKSEEIQSMFATNVFGPINIIKKMLPHWKERGSGQAITVTSIAGIMGFHYSSVYASTKFAIEGFIESLALELLPFPNIRMTLVEPGPVLTKFFSNSQGENPMNFEGIDEPTKEAMSDVSTSTPIIFEKVGQKGEDIANVIINSIVTDKPQLRYMTNDKFADLVKSKYTDLTGEKPLKAMSQWYKVLQ
ncbi:retinol dehydrogenase 8-like [Rhopilema esculentum]|uniref:retinol dehydrogenase 8-like n=1 Tax=Rhopilema esculentum TaxID=499914 RepID=UPI0031D935E5|eukprot:gene6049-11424_t